MATVYDLPTGRDPIWDAARAGYTWNEEQARRDVTARKSAAQEAFDRQLRELLQGGERARQSLAGNAENRGLLSSGLYEQAKARQWQDESTSQANLARVRTEQQSQADADLMRELARMAVERENAIGASRYRLRQEEIAAANAAQARAGGGSGGGGGAAARPAAARPAAPRVITLPPPPPPPKPPPATLRAAATTTAAERAKQKSTTRSTNNRAI